MAELTEEELALLGENNSADATQSAAAQKKSARRRPEVAKPSEHEEQSDPAGASGTGEQSGEQAKEEAPRGPLTPVQFDGDGWNDLPVQMRG